MTFARVSLDEAHQIRTWNRVPIKAMYEISANSRIACSGIPLNNDYSDIHSIFYFLRCEPWCDRSLFKQHYIKQSSKTKGASKLRNAQKLIFTITLAGISVRRRKMETFDGQLIGNVKRVLVPQQIHLH